MTVTLGPFFLSLATEGPGSKRKTTEPTMRAAAKSTFILRSERRSIHRQHREQSREPGPEEGVDTRCVRVAAGARGWTWGCGRPRSARSAPRSPCAATPSGRRRRGRGCGWLPRYRPLIGYAPRPPSASRRCAEGGVGIGLRKKTTNPSMPCGPTGPPYLRAIVRLCKAQSLPSWWVVFENSTYLAEVLGVEFSG